MPNYAENPKIRRRNGGIVSGAEVWRGPASGDKLQHEQLREVKTRNGGPHINDDRPGFSLCFMIPSAGTGGTTIRVWLSPEGFADLAEAMMQADPRAAKEAFGLVQSISEGLSKPAV